MSEEIQESQEQPEIQQEAIQEAPEQTASKESDTEVKARELGWKPKGEYEGENYVSAGEFLRRGELFDKIHSQGTVIKELTENVKFLSNRYKLAEKQAYEKALKDLQEQRIAAIQDSDVDRVLSIDKEAQEINRELYQYQMDTAPKNRYDDPAVKEFLSKNTWFNTNAPVGSKERTLTRDAVDLAHDFVKRNPNASPLEEVKYVESKMKELHSDYFKPVAMRSVEGSNLRAPRTTTRYRYEDLTPHQKMCCDSYVENGLGKAEDYIKELNEFRGVR